jgi:hypothetical protein
LRHLGRVPNRRPVTPAQRSASVPVMMSAARPVIRDPPGFRRSFRRGAIKVKWSCSCETPVGGGGEGCVTMQMGSDGDDGLGRDQVTGLGKLARVRKGRNLMMGRVREWSVCFLSLAPTEASPATRGRRGDPIRLAPRSGEIGTPGTQCVCLRCQGRGRVATERVRSRRQ